MKRYISDDGQNVTIVHNDGREEHLSVEEFEEYYGFSPLEEETSTNWDCLGDGDLDYYEIQAEILSPEELYWERFDTLCKTVGRVMARRAILRNADEHEVRVVVHDYYDHDLLHVHQSLVYAEAHAERVLNDFEMVGINLGLKPISRHGKELILKFLGDGKRRRYVRDWGRKYRDQGQIVDIGELMRQSYRQQKSLWPESWRENGCPY